MELFYCILIGFTCVTYGQQLPSTDSTSNEVISAPKLSLSSLLQGIEHSGFTSSQNGITGILDGFTGPSGIHSGPSDRFMGSSDGFTGPSDGLSGTSDGFVGPSDGFAGPSDGSTGSSDGFTGPSDGFTGLSDSFTTSINGFSGSSDGFTAASDGFSGSSDGFTAASDGFSGSSDGFTAASDGFSGSSDGFMTASDGFSGSSDGFTAPSDGFTASSDGFTDGFVSGSSSRDSVSSMDRSIVSSGNNVNIDGTSSGSDGIINSGIATSSDAFGPFETGSSQTFFQPKIRQSSDLSDVEFMSMGINPIPSVGNINPQPSKSVVVVVRSGSDSNHGIGTLQTRSPSSSPFSDGFVDVGSSTTFGFGPAAPNDGFVDISASVKSKTSMDTSDGFLSIDSGTMDGFLNTGIESTPGFGSSSSISDGFFSMNNDPASTYSTENNVRGGHPVVVEVASSRFRPSENKPIVVVSTSRPRESSARFGPSANSNRSPDRSRGSFDVWGGSNSRFTTEIPRRRSEPVIDRPLSSRRGADRSPTRSAHRFDTGMPPRRGRPFRSFRPEVRRDFDRFGDSFNPREPFLPRTDSGSRFGPPLPLVSFGDRPRITIGSMGTGSVGTSEVSSPLRGGQSSTFRGPGTRFDRDFPLAPTFSSATDADSMPPYVARLASSGSPSLDPFSSLSFPSISRTSAPREFGSLSTRPFSGGSFDFRAPMSSFDSFGTSRTTFPSITPSFGTSRTTFPSLTPSFGTSRTTFPSMSSSLFGPSRSFGMRSSIFPPSPGLTTSHGGGLGSSGIFGGATSPLMGSLTSPFMGSAGLSFPRSISTMGSFGPSLTTSPLSFGSFSGGFGSFPRSLGMTASSFGLGF
ncbi:hypothetical protein ACF0H5_004034 [Mactra antiquata]